MARSRLFDGSANSEDTNGNGQVDPGETDPGNPDTDSDGFDDGEEVAAGSDPLDPLSVPTAVPARGPLGGLVLCACLALAAAARRTRERGALG